jgi:hypothetical protein
MDSNNFIICAAHSGDQIKENEMGQACSLCGKRKQMHTGFWWKNTLKKKPYGKLRHRWEDNINTLLSGNV